MSAPAVTHLHAEPRPEGGAVRLTFMRPADYPEVRVLRVEEGHTPTGPDDPAGALVWDGPPLPGPVYRFIRHADPALEPALAGEVWDLEAFPDRFEDEANAIEGGAWTYWVWPKGESGYGEPSTVTVAVARALEARLRLNAKKVLYQRLRFHAREKGIWVALQEHVFDQKPLPQALVKARYTLTERQMGEENSGDGLQTTASFRVVGEVLLVTETPGQRDELGDWLTARLLGDLSLLEALGWDGLVLSGMDRMLDLGDAVLYARELSIEGLIDGFVARQKPYAVGALDLTWRIEL